jgi:hypothetical protein
MSLHLLNLDTKGSTVVLLKNLRLRENGPLPVAFVRLNCDEQVSEFFMLEQKFTDMILVTGDGFSIALTKGSQKVDAPIVFGIF